ncbi:hypothetical protein Bbelb_034740 [Branchiostoma belcheri]|nr:hypothetical protein Bbelb_034740 [Branchiostoma belcheri]
MTSRPLMSRVTPFWGYSAYSEFPSIEMADKPPDCVWIITNKCGTIGRRPPSSVRTAATVAGQDRVVFLLKEHKTLRISDSWSMTQSILVLKDRREQPIPGFRVGEHLEFMQQLEERYRQTVQPDMRNLAKP